MNLQHRRFGDILDMSLLYIIFIFPYEKDKQVKRTITTSVEYGLLFIVTEWNKLRYKY
jgi:hypothetical protein